jgi:hypothetical protein
MKNNENGMANAACEMWPLDCQRRSGVHERWSVNVTIQIAAWNADPSSQIGRRPGFDLLREKPRSFSAKVLRHLATS